MSETGFVDDWQSGKSLIDCNLHMLTSEDSYDVTFLVGENEAVVRAHRYVLMSRSCVFHAMLRGPLAERGEVRVPDVPELIFRDFLRFLYTDNVDMTPSNVTGLLYLGKKYAVGCLEKMCLLNLQSSLSADNSCTILEQAHRFDEEDLMKKALDVIVENSETTLMSQEFTELCNICFDRVIRSEEIAAAPEVIFTAALSWASEECRRQNSEITPQNRRKVLGDSIFHIGFPSMDAKTFAEVVVPTKLLSDEEHTRIFCHLTSQNTDVLPFKLRTMSLGGYKLLFYKDKVKAPEGRRMAESVSISCDHDVSVKGILVHRSKHRQSHSYKLSYWDTGLEDIVVPISTVSFIDKMCLDEITFQKHLILKAGVSYGITVAASTYNEVSPAHILGSELKTPIEIRFGRENVKFNMFVYSKPSGVIAGLVLAGH